MNFSLSERFAGLEWAASAQERKLRVAQLIAFINSLFAMGFALFHWVLGDIPGAVWLILMAVLIMMVSLYTPRLGSVWASNLVALLMALTLAYFQLGLGGIHAPHAAWFSLLPIIALLGANRRSVYFWLACAITFQLVLYFTYTDGIVTDSALLPSLDHPRLDVDALMVHLGQILALTLIVGVIESAREGAFFSLLKKSEELTLLNQTLEARVEAEVQARMASELAHEREIETTQKEVIMTMGTICEGRSEETGNHVRRVAEYSALLGRLSGLSESEQELLRIASPMHDIGKVAIPDAILNKPGRLTEEEYAEMTRHTTLGYEMLRGSSQPILKTAAIIAHQHHEKYDGSGYPNGLAGEAIHIYGRIIAIADFFDALGSERIYKKAWELDEVLALLREKRGSHFDPELVDLFFDNLDEFLLIRNSFRD